MITRFKKAAFFALPMALVFGAALLYSGILPYRVYAVRTGSMKPNIPPKSAVVVKEKTYEIGRPVTYMHDGELVTHRLLAVDDHGLITTKGDANDKPDSWHVPTTNIVGGVVAAPKMLGYWLVYLKNPLGLSSMLLGMLSIWLIWDLSKASEQKRAQKMPVPLDGLQRRENAPQRAERSAAL